MRKTPASTVSQSSCIMIFNSLTKHIGDMLAAFCKALEMTGTASKLKRFVLVTGAKHYGVHLGRVKIPMEETDPRYVLIALSNSELCNAYTFLECLSRLSPLTSTTANRTSCMISVRRTMSNGTSPSLVKSLGSREETL